jgi:hypothetical protein
MRVITIISAASCVYICYEYRDLFWGDMQGLQYGGYTILAGIFIVSLFLIMETKSNKE